MQYAAEMLIEGPSVTVQAMENGSEKHLHITWA